MYQLDFDINETAQSALDRIKNRSGVQEIKEAAVAADMKSAVNRERDMLDEFTLESLSVKLKADKYIYDILLSKVEENVDIDQALSTMIESITNVYEAINVAPMIYSVTENEIANNSEFENNKKAREIVESFLRDNLFKLSTEKREAKYKQRVTLEAQEFVDKYKASADKAIDYAYKSAVVRDLLETVHFPKFAKLYLEECLSSEMYAEFFKAEELEAAYHSYHESVDTISKIIATTL